MNKKMPSLDTKEENKKSDFVIQKYRDRLKVLRKGQEFSQAGNIAKAVESYLQYLKALATWHGIKETDLHPQYFDKARDIAELLLMSHVYWDLAKAYDRNPNLKNETGRCLNQFVKFSSGFKFQHVNAKMCKNYVTRRMAHNDDLFRAAFKRIQVDSKACFLASCCFEENTQELQLFRQFKQVILKYPLGFSFVEFYYRSSPCIVEVIEKHKYLGSIFKAIILKPALLVLAISIKPFLKISHKAL